MKKLILFNTETRRPYVLKTLLRNVTKDEIDAVLSCCNTGKELLENLKCLNMVWSPVDIEETDQYVKMFFIDRCGNRFCLKAVKGWD